MGALLICLAKQNEGGQSWWKCALVEETLFRGCQTLAGQLMKQYSKLVSCMLHHLCTFLAFDLYLLKIKLLTYLRYTAPLRYT